MAKLNLLRTTMYIEGRSIRKTVISALGEVHARRDDVRYFKRSIIGTVRYLYQVCSGITTDTCGYLYQVCSGITTDTCGYLYQVCSGITTDTCGLPVSSVQWYT